MIEAFRKWIARFGSRPWEDELQKAFEAGYRAGMNHDDKMKGRNRTRNPRPVKRKTKPTEPKIDKLLARLKDEQR